MKKIIILFSLLILSMTYIDNSHATEVIGTDTEVPDYCNDPLYNDSSLDYSACIDGVDLINVLSLADRSGYTRIEMIDGIWYGVINVTEVEVNSAYYGMDAYINNILVSFTRDLLDLTQIELDIVTVQDSCVGILAFNKYCLGSTADSYEDTIYINSTSNEDNWLSFLSGDYIHENDEYDYILFYEGPEIASVTVVKFTYILTDQEVNDLNLDIQEQFELEKNIIINNPLLTNDEKLILYIALMNEYKDYEIDFGDEMTSICYGEECDGYNENTTGDLPGIDPSNIYEEMPEWAKDILITLLKGVGLILGAIGSVSFIGIIAYMFVKKGLETTGNVALGGTKLTVRSSMWWGSMLGTGILELISIIGIGIKSIPWWGILTLISIIVSSIIILL